MYEEGQFDSGVVRITQVSEQMAKLEKEIEAIQIDLQKLETRLSPVRQSLPKGVMAPEVGKPMPLVPLAEQLDGHYRKLTLIHDVIMALNNEIEL